MDENGILARARISASKDSVAGDDRKAKVLFDKMYRRFVKMGPAPGAVVEGKYGYHSSESCRKHVAELSADAQKFSVALRKVSAFNPTDLNNDCIIEMDVASYTAKATKMEY